MADSSTRHILMTDLWDANLIVFRALSIKSVNKNSRHHRSRNDEASCMHEARTSALNLGEDPYDVAHVKRQLPANHRGTTATCRVCESRLCTEHTTSGPIATRETRPRPPPVKSHVFRRTPTYFTCRPR